MSCPHCCYDTSRVKGRFSHMSMETVRAALYWYGRREEVGNIGRLDIGGGEPTCHPEFWTVLAYCVETMAAMGKAKPWMVTNGKRKVYALRLASLAKEGVISCGLSQDRWHEPVDPEVVAAFMESGRRNGHLRDAHGHPVLDGRFVQDVGAKGRDPIRSGRCDWGRVECNGSGRPWVMTNGEVRQCGCLDSPVVGTVFAGFRPKDDVWSCWKGLVNPNTHRHQDRDIWGKEVDRRMA